MTYTVGRILSEVESLAPPHLAFESDRIGLLVGQPSQVVTNVVFCLDCTPSTVAFARKNGAELIVAHHPLIWDPVKQVRTDRFPGREISLLLQGNISLIAAHTNWDAAVGGINCTLARLLDLKDVEIPRMPRPKHYRLSTFVPQTHTKTVLAALTAAGGGQIGEYSGCSFVSAGMGHFTPSLNTNPHVGTPGSPTSIPEDRIEVEVEFRLVDACVAALQNVHPYEEPAFDLIPTRFDSDGVYLRSGMLANPVPLREFHHMVELRLNTRCLSWGDPNQMVKKVGVIGGAAGEMWPQALSNQCDAFVSGEIPHHHAILGSSSGLSMVQAGHFATESPGMGAMATQIGERLKGLPCHFFAPNDGQAGSPIVIT